MDALRGILRGAMLSAPWTARSPAPGDGHTHEGQAGCASHSAAALLKVRQAASWLVRRAGQSWRP